MGLPGPLKEEDRGRVDRRRDRAVDGAALRLGALRLRLCLLLTLLRLPCLLAGLPLWRLSAHRPIGSNSRHDDRDGQSPLHADDVTTPRLNGK